MQARTRDWTMRLPEAAAILAGGAVGLLAALGLAAPLATFWSSYLVPAFGNLLSTLYIC